MAARCSIIERLEFINQDITRQINDGCSKIVARASYDEASPQAVFQQRRVKSFNYFMATIEQVYTLLKSGQTATKRDLYYNAKLIFGEQRSFDVALTHLCNILEVPRSALNVVSSSKGMMSGNVTLRCIDGSLIDCRGQPAAIFESMMNAKLIADIDFILVVEKDAIFQRLIQMQFHSRFPKALLVTGRGYPDICTRQVLKWIVQHLTVPVHGLFDCDPHGIEIFLTYKYGRMLGKAESQGAFVRDMQWMGLQPGEIRLHPVSRSQLLPLNNLDFRKITKLKMRAKMIGEVAMIQELDALHSYRAKFELEALTTISDVYMVDTYLANKLRQHYQVPLGQATTSHSQPSLTGRRELVLRPQRIGDSWEPPRSPYEYAKPPEHHADSWQPPPLVFSLNDGDFSQDSDDVFSQDSDESGESASQERIPPNNDADWSQDEEDEKEEMLDDFALPSSIAGDSFGGISGADLSSDVRCEAIRDFHYVNDDFSQDEEDVVQIDSDVIATEPIDVHSTEAAKSECINSEFSQDEDEEFATELLGCDFIGEIRGTPAAGIEVSSQSSEVNFDLAAPECARFDDDVFSQEEEKEDDVVLQESPCAVSTPLQVHSNPDWSEDSCEDGVEQTSVPSEEVPFRHIVSAANAADFSECGHVGVEEIRTQRLYELAQDYDEVFSEDEDEEVREESALPTREISPKEDELDWSSRFSDDE